MAMEQKEMLMVESSTQDRSSCGPLKSPIMHHSAANGLNETSTPAVLRDSHAESPMVLAGTESRMSCNPKFRGMPVEGLSTVSVPPFLHPLVKTHYTSLGKASPFTAYTNITKTTTKEQAAASTAGHTRLPSAPSTSSTTTAETTTKITGAPFREPSHEKIRACANSTFDKTQLDPVQGGTGTPTRKPLQIESSPTSLSGPYKPTDLGVPAVGDGCSAPAKQCPTMQHKAHSNEDYADHNSTLPLMRAIRRSNEGGTEGSTCKGMPYDSSVACLVAALGASSLRLAAAAEEGLGSSPSDAGSRLWHCSDGYPLRRSGNVTTELRQTISPPTAATNSLASAQRRTPPATRRALPASKAMATNRSRRSLPPSLGIARSYAFQEPTLQIPRKSPNRGVLRAVTHGSTTKPTANHNNELGPILLDLNDNGANNAQTVCNNAQTVSMVSQESETLNCSPAPVGSPRSSNSDSKKSTQGSHTTLSKEATAIPTSNPDDVPWENLRRPPLIAHGSQRVESMTQDCAPEAHHGEEEHQFSLLLQHSLGLLRREAARCFASSQASVKQKLWRELQHERHLRLQLQQEHQVGAAAAEAALASLRAQKLEDNERLEKIMGICCRRKHTDEGSQLLRFAWKGWQLQRLLTGRLKKLQQALQQRHLFKLQLRAFLPWRAAAARRTLEQHIQRAQRLFQQEVQRLGQVHIENTQKQQQELRLLRQQLNNEIHLRECLQQSLIGLVAGGGIGASSQGAQAQSPSNTICCAPGPSSRILNANRQQRPKTQENCCRQQKLLNVVGTQSNLRSRRTLASQNSSRQQHDEQVQQCNYTSKQSWCQWVLQNAGLGVPAPLLPSLYKFDPPPVNGFAADAARRVKFTDEQAHQQQQNQQEKLLLLANLLSESSSQTQDYSGTVPGQPPSAQACRHQHCCSSGLASDSSSTFGCWELISDITSFKKNAATVRRHSSEENSLLKPACIQTNARLGEKHNYSANGLWNTSPVGSLKLECHPHKQTRWTSAGQSNLSM